MSAADADQLRQAWDYIERNGFQTRGTGYASPGDERAACALGALAYTAKLDLIIEAAAGDALFAIVKHTWRAARWLYRTQPRQPRFGDLHQRAAVAIFQHNDKYVKTIDKARAWFAAAIALAEADA
ncbi:DUF6197 family protein [Mycobacteroides immunogenum]|uniref:Uncharacterized protein n=1 Tax=Mycobacteroides immunogenum TaxID=83262 RepID=A0A7V8LJC8_9MYCO|nr:hypothetical protein [Mycobacteroides immunogenum]AMT71950.1 hypothetical protein ABG82_18285 [Mycobacteroides immunogenum]ANO05082.1 hypothetical protein BAB75_18570 [Mycobacteroides immunogenum]KIU40244.1 hypothetical protein TL11_13395 [Mycobacteroides immunogenum]KPG02846.1 hypothetical protein AN909_26435 [Mycobacteroides immunogenum]KPG02934.1 hypothetical protein AN908_26885 [Mycobacteroides immunogenum]